VLNDRFGGKSIEQSQMTLPSMSLARYSLPKWSEAVSPTTPSKWAFGRQPHSSDCIKQRRVPTSLAARRSVAGVAVEVSLWKRSRQWHRMTETHI